ncbi:hypothetical protein [Algoriphagus aquimarinus]|uniref:hypothetical protein n=1 Tax=Algoriphagus aquimarinus TaxID=237018 RepID=UPI0030DA6E0A|tara:strand:+ start:50315 stop:50563 length:249 start_codon:yes stop_codon:yes gene_type:complete
MDRSLSPKNKALLKELENLNARVVTKLEKIGYSKGWEERKKKGNDIRLLVVEAIFNLELRRFSRMGDALRKLEALGLTFSNI